MLIQFSSIVSMLLKSSVMKEIQFSSMLIRFTSIVSILKSVECFQSLYVSFFVI